MSVPQSTIYVCSGVRLDSRYEHTIYFESENLQRAFFMGKVVKQFSTYSYIRKSWNIKLQTTLEEAIKWNYLFFHNSENGKWYYYFINQVEYVNEATVELTLEMDVMQTYLFDYALLPCFVERQHTESDEIGEHTLDEGLDLGELVINGSFEAIKFDGTTYKGSLTDLCILILSSLNPATGQAVKGTYMNNVYSGLGIFAVDTAFHSNLSDLLAGLEENTDAIVNIWMYPKCLVELEEVPGKTEEEVWRDDTNIIHPVVGCQDFEFPVDKNMELDGYGPEVRNKKLFTYPYNFLYCTNNTGNAGTFHYELFQHDICTFGVSGAISPDGGAHISPQYYNGESWNWEAGITLNSYPSCAWNADVYKMWLALNQNQQGLTMLNSGLSIAGGAIASIGSLATGNILGASAGAGGIISGASTIANLVAQKKDMELQPPQARGSHSSSVNVANSRNRFDFYFKSIKAEVAKVIDDYFDLYGYKINRVMKPKPLTRTFYTYTKTVGCKIVGKNGSGMCNEDLIKIESIFDNGITFWAEGNIVGDYVACQGANLPR